jgi:hypothetical protein
MLVISMKEFRSNQNKYLGLAKEGEKVILKSRENGNFALTPVTEFTTTIPKEYVLEPDEDLDRAITGEKLLERLVPRIEKLFDK